MKRATRKRRTKRSEIGNSLWDSVTDDWKCPACQRFKQEILRKIDGLWKGGLHNHHDHSVDDPDRYTDKVKFKEAYNLLDNLTELKSSSKGMFDDVFVAKMIKDAQSGAQGFIEAEDIVTYFVDQGRSKAFLRLMNALPASEREVFKAAVARHTFDDVLNSSKNKRG